MREGAVDCSVVDRGMDEDVGTSRPDRDLRSTGTLELRSKRCGREGAGTELEAGKPAASSSGGWHWLSRVSMRLACASVVPKSAIQ